MSINPNAYYQSPVKSHFQGSGWAAAWTCGMNVISTTDGFGPNGKILSNLSRIVRFVPKPMLLFGAVSATALTLAWSGLDNTLFAKEGSKSLGKASFDSFSNALIAGAACLGGSVIGSLVFGLSQYQNAMRGRTILAGMASALVFGLSTEFLMRGYKDRHIGSRLV